MDTDWSTFDRLMQYVIWPAIGFLGWWLKGLQEQHRTADHRMDVTEKDLLKLQTILEERDRRRNEDRDIYLRERAADQRMYHDLVAEMKAATNKLADRLDESKRPAQ